MHWILSYHENVVVNSLLNRLSPFIWPTGPTNMEKYKLRFRDLNNEYLAFYKPSRFRRSQEKTGESL